MRLITIWMLAVLYAFYLVGKEFLNLSHSEKSWNKIVVLLLLVCVMGVLGLYLFNYFDQLILKMLDQAITD